MQLIIIQERAITHMTNYADGTRKAYYYILQIKKLRHENNILNLEKKGF